MGWASVASAEPGPSMDLPYDLFKATTLLHLGVSGAISPVAFGQQGVIE